MATDGISWPRRVRKLRRAKEWTQLEMAVEVGVHVSTVAKWEQSVVLPDKRSRARLEKLGA